MNIDQIRELAEICRKNGLTAIEINEGDTHIRLESEPPVTLASQPAPQLISMPTPQLAAPMLFPMEQPASASDASAANAAPAKDIGVDFNELFEIKSPLVGLYYASSSPDAKPFVSVGDKVKAGDVLCIVEAMKLMNEITAERDGEIVDICMHNGDVVEYGQTLFKLF